MIQMRILNYFELFKKSEISVTFSFLHGLKLEIIVISKLILTKKLSVIHQKYSIFLQNTFKNTLFMTCNNT